MYYGDDDDVHSLAGAVWFCNVGTISVLMTSSWIQAKFVVMKAIRRGTFVGLRNKRRSLSTNGARGRIN